MAYVNDSSLTLYLNANGYSNPTSTWTDLSGNGNNGILNNFAYNSSSGWNDNTLVLDGTDDYIQSTLTNSISSDEFTFELQFSMLNTGGGYNTVLQVVSGSTAVCKIERDNSQLYISSLTGSAQYFNFPFGADFHVLQCRTTKTTYQLYLDGTQIQNLTRTAGTGLNINNLYLSKWHDASGGYINGQFKLIRFYNRALTDAEITQNYNDAIGLGGTDVIITSVVIINTLTAISPAVTAEFNVSISSIVATSTTELITPQVSTGVSYTVNAPPISNSLSINIPTIETIENVNINSLVSSSNININIPSVSVSYAENVNINSSIINSLVTVNNPTIQVSGNVNTNPLTVISSVSLNIPIVEAQRNIIINATLFNSISTQNIPAIWNNVYSQYLSFDLTIVNKQEFTSNITKEINFDLSL